MVFRVIGAEKPRQKDCSPRRIWSASFVSEGRFRHEYFISAFAIPGSRAEAAIPKAVAGEIHLVISRPIIHEVLDVLARKFERNSEELARVAVYLSELAEMVTPRRRLKVLRDEPDNRILECAVTGKVDVTVTGDRAMLELAEYRKIRIQSLKEFLDAV